jgi:hypothetical protein
VSDALSRYLCNGLTITEAANVTFSPGVYVFKNGALTITGRATAQGTYVGLYFTGAGATFHFDAASTISFTAPKTGATMVLDTNYSATDIPVPDSVGR